MNRSRRKRAASLLITLSACGKIGSQPAGERYVVGVVTKSGSSEYWMPLLQGMEAAFCCPFCPPYTSRE